MKLAKILKDLKKLSKKEDDFGSILSEIISSAAESEFDSKYCEIQVSRNLWGYNWTYHKDSKGKKIKSSDYYDQLSTISKNKGTDGATEFEKAYTQVYDYKVYEAEVKTLNLIGKRLNKMGFKYKVHYSKDYKKCTLENQPCGLWLLVSW